MCNILHSQVKGLGMKRTMATEKHGNVPKLDKWSNKLLNARAKALLCIFNRSIAYCIVIPSFTPLSQDNNLACSLVHAGISMPSSLRWKKGK